MKSFLAKSFSVFAVLLLVPFFPGFGQDNIFEGWNTKEFEFQGHEAKIVFPNQKVDGNYWIWRALFWGHEPQLDKALLENGFHVVYVDVAGLFGNKEAVALWDDFYQYLIKEYNLNSKAVLEGMSRGGLIIYNWASKTQIKLPAFTLTRRFVILKAGLAVYIQVTEALATGRNAWKLIIWMKNRYWILLVFQSTMLLK